MLGQQIKEVEFHNIIIKQYYFSSDCTWHKHLD